MDDMSAEQRQAMVDAVAAEQPAVQKSEDNVRTLSEVRKMSKIDMKRLQAYEERKRRLINKGVAPDKVDGVIAAEDYANLPVEKKFERLESMVSQVLQGLQRDIMSLRHNDGVIADAMDINLRAVARSLEKAGVTKEQQGEIVKLVEAEIREEQKAQQAIRQKAQEAQTEKSRMEAEANAKPSIMDPEPALPTEAPAEATVFGG